MHIQSMDKPQAQKKNPESQNVRFWRHIHFSISDISIRKHSAEISI